jgi:hypothetical protein
MKSVERLKRSPPALRVASGPTRDASWRGITNLRYILGLPPRRDAHDRRTARGHHRLLAEYHRRLAKEAVLDVVQQYHSALAQRLSDDAVLIPRRTAIVERLHEREQQKRTMASEPDRSPHHHVHAADSGARNHLEFARPLNVMASAARSHVSHSSSRSWCGIDKRRSATMSGLTRIPDSRQTSGHVRKVPANLAHAQCRCDPRQMAGTSGGQTLCP